MENTAEIRSLNLLSAAQADQAVTLLVDSFYDMFQSISKDRELLRRLFAPCMRTDSVYILLEDGRAAGLIAFSNAEKRAIQIDRAVCVSIFGKARGNILAWQLQKILGTPAVNDSESGYIDFLAVAPEYRRKGAAAALMTFAEKNAGFSRLYLDVLDSNTSAIRLYQKLGYQMDGVKNGFLQRLAGMNAMYIMKKDVPAALL